MKLQLTAAALTFSVSIISGSSPAFAETVITEGIWNGAQNRFEFYNDRLDSDASTPFALFGSYGPTPDFTYKVLTTNIDLHNPYVFNSDTDWEKYTYYSRIVSSERILDFERSDYRNGAFDQKELFHYDTVGTVPYYYYYRKQMADNEVYESSNPFDVNALGNTIQSVFPASGVGIFDFEHSFVYYETGESMSLAQIISNNLYNPVYSHESDAGFSLDTSNNDFEIRWGGEGGPVGRISRITLAYNLPAVPEPTTWAMLLAGLGVVGAIARRKATVITIKR